MRNNEKSKNDLPASGSESDQTQPRLGLFDKSYPVINSRSLVLFPNISTVLSIDSESGKRAVSCAKDCGDHLIFATEIQGQETKKFNPIAVLAELRNLKGDEVSGFQIDVKVVAKVHATEFSKVKGATFAKVSEYSTVNDIEEDTADKLIETIRQQSIEILKMIPADMRHIIKVLRNIKDLEALVDIAAFHSDAKHEEKYHLLKTTSLKQRALQTLDILQKVKEKTKLQLEIGERISKKMGKTQREQVLREQLTAIREELSEIDETTEDSSFADQIDASKMPDEVKEIARKEARRLESISSQSPETNVIRSYLELLLELPWQSEDVDEIDLEYARKVLDKDHYGLDKVKKHIIQHLAVMKLKKSKKGNIILLVGPPGVGKTSLGRSIAKALNRKFIRSSLGGVRDEAEIRGHRRTYIGAMPGKIIEEIKRGKSKSPVFLLDEIDKMGVSFAGDPSAALLEVLDPEQNHTFKDHYVDVPFDLSEVFFIATANATDKIPAPLLDRMEVISLSGYTSQEKLKIAKDHLLPNALELHGIGEAQFSISDKAIEKMIHNYTKEAGVRSLKRQFATVCRASTEKILGLGKGESLRVTEEDLADLLGPEAYSSEITEKFLPPGVATGLAWTPVGGDILYIEAKKMPGTGKLILTGQLGDVMKESAQIALSHVRANLASLIPGWEFDKNDLHIHVPAGAIPKDGPSAGVTMLVTLASLFTSQSVSPKLAMTGEITLRGAVTPVGGIKEKVIAAHRAEITDIIISSKNEKDLVEIPQSIRSTINFHFVDRVEDVLKVALGIKAFGSNSSHAPKSHEHRISHS